MDLAQPADCNPNPSDECIHGADDHPDNLYRCADCNGEFARDELHMRRWGGTAFICAKCDEIANELPF